MELLKVDPTDPGHKAISRAARILRKGGLVAFPTETVYGLGARGLDAAAVARIYEAKGRPAWNPVIQHVASAKAASHLVRDWTRDAALLAERFWPGPLTLVLPKSPKVPDIATAGLDAVAMRVPAHPVALALLRELGEPIAAPSANRFTQLSPTSARHVRDSLGDRVDLILDGGDCAVGIESTVVDLTGPAPVVLRPGMISRRQLEEVLGQPVASATERIRTGDSLHSAARSPGMAVRHYAPRADVWLVRTSEVGDVKRALAALAPGDRVALLALSDGLVQSLSLPPESTMVRMPAAPDEYARMLYATLHAADRQKTSIIIIEQPPGAPEWDAIRDRLTRAAAIP
jgi:L-threonylcarbamoyladenylate synthase